MLKIRPSLPLFAACLWLAGCEQKPTTQADPAQQKALQDMQARMDEISARADQLNQQLADKKTADFEEKQAELKKLQADLEQQQQELADQKRELANSRQEIRSKPDATSPAASYSASEPASYDLFYDRLQDDGAWVETNDYGYIWQPNIARRSGWRPYTDGHWAQTNRGWTWMSNESFGWATYHYGRWIEITGFGWCWVPGTEWSPGWVSWRKNDTFVGWAPLPPQAILVEGGPSIGASIDVEFGTGPDYYNFVEVEYFGEPSYVGHLVDPNRNITIINETTNITNISYNKTVVYNYGPDFEDLRRRSRRPVERYELELERDRDREKGPTSITRGNILTVLAPLIQNKPDRDRGQQPRKVERKIERAEQDKGWRNYGPDQTRQARENLKEQADRARTRRPENDEKNRAKPDSQVAAESAKEKPEPRPVNPKPDAAPLAADEAKSDQNREKKDRDEVVGVPRMAEPEKNNAQKDAPRQPADETASNRAQDRRENLRERAANEPPALDRPASGKKDEKDARNDKPETQPDRPAALTPPTVKPVRPIIPPALKTSDDRNGDPRSANPQRDASDRAGQIPGKPSAPQQNNNAAAEARERAAALNAKQQEAALQKAREAAAARRQAQEQAPAVTQPRQKESAEREQPRQKEQPERQQPRQNEQPERERQKRKEPAATATPSPRPDQKRK